MSWVGEESDFHTIHGIYVEGIHKDTVVLPYGWDNRLVHFTVAGTEVGQYGRTALCLDTIDLCVSKTIAGRGKDQEFVGALIREKIVTPAAILDRIDKSGIEWPSVYRDDRELALSRARNWLSGVANRPVSRLTNRAMHPPGITVDYSSIVGGLASGLAAAAQPNPRSVSRLLRSENSSGRDDHNELDAERAPKAAEHGYDVTD